MSRCVLQRMTNDEALLAEMIPEAAGIPMQVGVHAFEGVSKRLLVILSIDRFTVEEAFLEHLGVQSWLHISVSVVGQNAARLKDQNRIGRARNPGERSPVPLPDWYDLTHLAYEHPELGFSRDRDVYQVLPHPGAGYVNIAEALHLRQPL